MLDIKSVYDTVWREGLVHKLVGIGLDPYIVARLQSFLTDRYSRLEIRDAPIEVWPECGFPQGSPLSCTLFIIYIDDLLWTLHRIRQLRSQGFADDMSLWASMESRLERPYPVQGRA